MIINLVVMVVLRAVMVFMVFTSHKVINEAIKNKISGDRGAEGSEVFS